MINLATNPTKIRCLEGTLATKTPAAAAAASAAPAEEEEEAVTTTKTINSLLMECQIIPFREGDPFTPTGDTVSMALAVIITARDLTITSIPTSPPPASLRTQTPATTTTVESPSPGQKTLLTGNTGRRSEWWRRTVLKSPKRNT